MDADLELGDLRGGGVGGGCLGFPKEGLLIMLAKGFSRDWFGKERLTSRSTACLLAVVFVSVLTLHSCRSEDKSQGVGVDRELAALLPSNPTSLMGADILRLKTTPVYRLLEAESRKNEQPHQDFDRMAAQIGFDPWQDLDRVLAASWVDAFR